MLVVAVVVHGEALLEVVVLEAAAQQRHLSQNHPHQQMEALELPIEVVVEEEEALALLLVILILMVALAAQEL